MIPTILVTGGAGFIGSCFVRQQLENARFRIVNLDALTYAGNLWSLPSQHPDLHFVRGDIADTELVRSLLKTYRPQAIVHFAAESHVDRSIDGPAAFVHTNVVGTFNLLQESLHYYRSLSELQQNQFSLPACLHRRSVRIVGRDWQVHGNDGLFSEFSLFRFEGSLRFVRSGLP